jgi:hypothetical protein
MITGSSSQLGISIGSLPRLHRVFQNRMKLSGFVDLSDPHSKKNPYSWKPFKGFRVCYYRKRFKGFRGWVSEISETQKKMIS